MEQNQGFARISSRIHNRHALAMPILTPLIAAAFALCASGPRITCVVDGDTFWLHGEKIRIADINAPETHSAACPAEAVRGAAATRRLIGLLNAGPFALETGTRDRDRYGRQLRIVRRGGSSLGAALVEAGLAERWQGRRGDWCGGALPG
jgi:micrococcal nuclease